MGKRAQPKSDTERKLLRKTHNALDSLESSLRALAPPDGDEPIDLVLQLRRKIIEVFPDTPPDKS